MRNIRELSIGSIVAFFQSNGTEVIGEVVGIREHHEGSHVIGVRALQINLNDVGDAPDQDLRVGKVSIMRNGRINPILISEDVLRKLDFIDSDEKAWKLLYYFGDMRLYFKYDKKLRTARFKFKPDFTQKTWIRIDCHYVHQLQNIMRFLTWGELEFTYKNNKQ